MSITFGYFFNSELGLRELGRKIGACLGCSLSPYAEDPADLFSRFLGMELSLHTAEGYVNDRELDFESCGFELGIRIPAPDVDLRPIALPVMLAVVHTLHRRLGITGMLVFDTQRLLARYEERTDETGASFLFDQVSGCAVDDFAGHLAYVQTRQSETI